MQGINFFFFPWGVGPPPPKKNTTLSKGHLLVVD